ncbi:MAG: type IV pili twitching motility protein PilT, partial [Candidatus Eremiobacteraeota bacterium]|nr:type IV pili twitching motility protein PilT [Candidatus Eremiobacteraeota bacterium]
MSNLLTPMRLDELLRFARSKNASDLHISPSAVPVLRVDGQLQPFGSQTSVRDCELLTDELLDA